jgi:hypothetical protein
MLKLSDPLGERREWKCPEGCGEQYWAHQLYGDYDLETQTGTLKCPPPPEPRDCCGRMPVPENDETRACSNGRCRAWWCVCGTFTGMSDGPVMCDCEYDRGEVSTDPPTEPSTS